MTGPLVSIRASDDPEIVAKVRLLRDLEGLTWADIARRFGRSTTWTRRAYQTGEVLKDGPATGE